MPSVLQKINWKCVDKKNSNDYSTKINGKCNKSTTQQMLDSGQCLTRLYLHYFW